MRCLALGIGAALVIGIGARAQSPSGAAPREDPRAAIFVQRECNVCHGIWALGLTAKSDVAPDLTFAYVDVVNRYGMSLQAFLQDPTGVMRLVLQASHLRLSIADRDSIAHVLEGIYKEHRAQIHQEIPSIAPDSSPPK
jgi:hypothetical protein